LSLLLLMLMMMLLLAFWYYVVPVAIETIASRGICDMLYA